MVQWLRLCTSTAGDMGLIPGWGPKIPHAMLHSQDKNSQILERGYRLTRIHPPANAGDVRDTGSISGWERSPGGGHGNPLQYSCLENPTDRGALQATVHRVAKSWTRLKWLSTEFRHRSHNQPLWGEFQRKKRSITPIYKLRACYVSTVLFFSTFLSPH